MPLKLSTIRVTIPDVPPHRIQTADADLPGVVSTTIAAHPHNNSPVWIGGPTVNLVEGIPLAPGERYTIAGPLPLTQLYALGDTDNEVFVQQLHAAAEEE